MPAQSPEDLKAAIEANAKRFRVAGWAMIVLGVVAVLFPLASSIMFKALIGWFFLLSGAALLWHAFQTRAWGPALWIGLIAVFQLALGVYLAFFPLTGLIGLTLLMALVFLFQGGAEMIVAIQNRGSRGWIWMLMSGLISDILGIMLIAGLPGTAMWAIGLMIGINLISSGAAFLALVSTLKKR